MQAMTTAPLAARPPSFRVRNSQPDRRSSKLGQAQFDIDQVLTYDRKEEIAFDVHTWKCVFVVVVPIPSVRMNSISADSKYRNMAV